MNSEPFTIVTQTPFSTFDHMVIGIVLVIVMSVLAVRKLVHMVAARSTPPEKTDWKDAP